MHEMKYWRFCATNSRNAPLANAPFSGLLIDVKEKHVRELFQDEVDNASAALGVAPPLMQFHADGVPEAGLGNIASK